MKHVKTFEINKSVSSIKNVMNEYHEILKYIRPAVIKRYNEIANSSEMDYGQDIVDVYGGDSFFVIHSMNNIRLTEMKMHDNKIFFTLEYTEPFDETSNTFYVPFTEEELERSMIDMESNKYNL